MVNLPFCILLTMNAVNCVYEKCQSIDYILIFDCQTKMKCFAMNNEVNNYKKAVNEPNKGTLKATSVSPSRPMKE